MLFFLIGDYGPYDKNLPYWSSDLRAVIKRMGDYCKLGIHPSFRSNSKSTAMQIEIDRLADIAQQDIDSSRQHYLILRHPDTYRHLLNCGIKHDYTMGFAGEVGFRSGMCLPYPYYDLDLEVTTALMIHPFAYMDGTLNEYMNYSPDEAKKVVSELAEEVKQFKGEFICIWHNETLNNKGKWAHWRQVFEHTIDVAGE